MDRIGAIARYRLAVRIQARIPAGFPGGLLSTRHARRSRLETFRAVNEGGWLIRAANMLGGVRAGYVALWLGVLPTPRHVKAGPMLKPGPAKKITVYIGEDVHHHGEPLYLAVLNYLFYNGVAGATVTKGVAGFGADHRLHTARILEVSENLPIKIEFVAAVSVKPEFGELFQHWRKQELEPVIKDQQRERLRAAARKTEILRAQVESVLKRWSAVRPTTAAPDVTAGAQASAAVLQAAAGQITARQRRIDDLTVVLPRRAPEIMARAADAICRHVDPETGLADAFRDVADGAAQEIARELQDLSASLVTVCRQVSQAIGWTADANDRPDRGPQFREVPIPALPAGIQVPGRRGEHILGRRLARAILTSRLERAVGATIRSTLEGYAAVLGRWALNRLEDIRTEWTAATDPLRADMDRRLGHAAQVSVDAEAVRQDLQRLSGLAMS